MATEIPSTVAGARVVMRRELRALFADKQARVMAVIFTLLFPFLLSSNASRRPGGILGVAAQVMLFPHIGAFSASVASLAGEREHGTIGPLLATPLDNASILFGKLLGAFVPGFAQSLVSTTLFFAFMPERSREVLRAIPTHFLIESFALATVAGLFFAVGGVVIGATAKTVRGGQMVAGLTFAPLLIATSFVGSLLLSHEAVALAVLAGMVALNIAGVRIGARLWHREEILTKSG